MPGSTAKKTLVVNLYGGPGTGKSTNAALAFGKLKVRGHNAELVHEFAKDLTWEERGVALSYQPYIMGKQSFHVYRVQDKVDVVVTDAPILLGNIYRGPGWTQNFGNHLAAVYNSWWTLDLFLERDAEHHPYNPKGRNQTEEESMAIDEEIKTMLQHYGFPYTIIPIREGEKTADAIVELVENKLQLPPYQK